MAHHYVLPMPDGRRMLPATCKKCGHVRMYRASIDDERKTWVPHVPGLGRSEVRYVYD